MLADPLEAGEEGVDLVRVEQLAELGAQRPRARRVGEQPRRAAGAARSASCWPQKSQITVRSFGTTLKQSPWSMPQIRPSRPLKQWPALRSALFGQHVEQRDRAQLVDVLLAEPWYSVDSSGST